MVQRAAAALGRGAGEAATAAAAAARGGRDGSRLRAWVIWRLS